MPSRYASHPPSYLTKPSNLVWMQDYSLCGFGPLIAPLLQNGRPIESSFCSQLMLAPGTLDGLDLHTYYNVIYAPMSGTYSRSAQYNFQHVLEKNNVTRPVSFYSTEFNFNRR